MRRLIPKSLNQWLLASAGLAILLAWLTGYWTSGSLAALAAVSAVLVRTDTVRRRIWSGQKSSAVEAEPSPAPPAPRATRDTLINRNLSLLDQMIGQRRVALLLRPQIASSLSAGDRETAQAALDELMAIVPQGPVSVRARCYDGLNENTAERAERLIHVEGFFLDRYTVTNSEYQQFVDDGGYEQMSLWDESIWPAVLGFVDATGQSGPRFWENGVHNAGKEDHPVVGVSWYEACAFARWAGKRLPTDPEWVKAGAWPVVAEGAKPVQRRFPWGDSMDRKRANIWGSGYETTVPVHCLESGGSVNGVQQLVGNVWEWTSSAFGGWEPSNRKIETHMPLKSIRGGAFDTYFDTQSHCQFQSGESPLSRKRNIGFRCALGFCDVVHMSDEQEPAEFEKAAATPEEVLV